MFMLFVTFLEFREYFSNITCPMRHDCVLFYKRIVLMNYQYTVKPGHQREAEKLDTVDRRRFYTGYTTHISFSRETKYVTTIKGQVSFIGRWPLK